MAFAANAARGLRIGQGAYKTAVTATRSFATEWEGTLGRLDDKVAVITGSDSGIGQATAIAFAHEGADVVINYLEDAAVAASTKASVEREGRRAIVVQADIGDKDDLARLFSEALAASGRSTS